MLKGRYGRDLAHAADGSERQRPEAAHADRAVVKRFGKHVGEQEVQALFERAKDHARPLKADIDAKYGQRKKNRYFDQVHDANICQISETCCIVLRL